MVNGAAVKPAMDKSGLVMIPLEKASKSSNESSTTSLVEFVYIQRVCEKRDVFILMYF